MANDTVEEKMDDNKYFMNLQKRKTNLLGRRHNKEADILKNWYIHGFLFIFSARL